MTSLRVARRAAVEDQGDDAREREPDRDADEQQEAEHLTLRVDEAGVRADLVGAVEREGQDHRDDHAERGAERAGRPRTSARGAAASARRGPRCARSCLHCPTVRGATGTLRGQGRSGSRSETSARMPEARMRPAAAASAHAPRRGERDPGRRVGLDDVRRRAAGVPRTLDDLHRAERRDAHLDAVPGRLLGQELQQVAHGGREVGAGGQGCRAAARTPSSAARPSSVVILRGMAPRYAVSQLVLEPAPVGPRDARSPRAAGRPASRPD